VGLREKAAAARQDASKEAKAEGQETPPPKPPEPPSGGDLAARLSAKDLEVRRLTEELAALTRKLAEADEQRRATVKKLAEADEERTIARSIRTELGEKDFQIARLKEANRKAEASIKVLEGQAARAKEV